VNELALFAGAGGGILGGTLLGWRTVCAVECDAYAASVLVARQNDGILEPFPIWDDVRTFYGRPWRGIVDVVSGGFPCQDISCAGGGDGLDGERSGLWKEFARIVGEVRPRYAFIENSPMLTLRGGDRVIADLAALGYDARWGIISAADAGAPHLRERIWIVARAEVISAMADAGGQGLQTPECQTVFGARRRIEGRTTAECSWWQSEPDVGRVAHGLADKLDSVRTFGQT
jgi:DNA (cytosine-5)-methyltransferase 1